MRKDALDKIWGKKTLVKKQKKGLFKDW